MNFEQLKEDGYYILVERGSYNHKPIPNCYSIVKDTSSTSRSIACLINRIGERVLIDMYGFIELFSIKETCWLNRPEHLDFIGEEDPLKITWDK